MSSTPPSSDDEMLQKELSEKRKRIEDIKQEIWEMKLEMSRLRKDILSQELSYKRLKDDPEYKQLLTLIGKTENWDDGWKDPEENYTVEPYKPSRKFFLSIKEADELRKKDPTFRKDNDDESWKKIPQKVFIKEFDKPKEVLEAELRQLKGIAEEEERQAAQKRQKQFLLMNEGVKRFKKLGDDLKKEVNKIKDIQRELPSKDDLSKYFGENLPSKIASLVVIVALIMLFRYGVEHGYISPWMRLLTGITIGTGFFILSHYLIHKKVNLTTILNMCGGLVFYYTIYLAYGPYQYIPQLTAFGLTLIVTIASIALAYYYDRKGLALSTLLGGYTVPMLLLEENDHYAWFFFYIFLLNAVMMVVGYLKKWRIVNVIGTLTTAFLLFVEFLGTDLTENDRLFWIIVLATAFYWIFYLANVVFTIREDVSFKTIDGFLLIFITGLYVYKMLKFLPLTGQESLIGIFFASIMLFNLAAVWILYGNRMADEPLIRLLIAKVIFSGSLSAFYFLPNIYFNAFLAFWAVTLFYMANLFKVSMLKDFSTYLMLAALASLSYLWKNTYFGLLDNTQLFVNEAFLGSVFTFSAAAILFFWVLDEKDLPQLAFFSRDYWLKFLFVVLTAGIYLTLFMEILIHTPNLVGGSDFRKLLLSFYTLAYQIGMYVLAKRYKISIVENITRNLMIVASLSYLVVGRAETIALRDAYMMGGSLFPFLFHYLNVACIIGLIVMKIKEVVQREGMENPKFVYLSWYAMAMAVFLATIESEHLLVFWQAHPETLPETLTAIRVVWYSILWTAIAFGFMYAGITRQQKDLRVIALVLMGINFGKFILHDFWQLTPLAKIISVIVVGLLIYTVSRMYAYLRKIVEEGKVEQLRIEKLEYLREKVNQVADKLNLKKQAEKALKENQKLQKLNNLVTKITERLKAKKKEENPTAPSPEEEKHIAQQKSNLEKLSRLVSQMTERLKEKKEIEKSIRQTFEKLWNKPKNE